MDNLILEVSSRTIYSYIGYCSLNRIRAKDIWFIITIAFLSSLVIINIIWGSFIMLLIFVTLFENIDDFQNSLINLKHFKQISPSICSLEGRGYPLNMEAILMVFSCLVGLVVIALGRRHFTNIMFLMFKLCKQVYLLIKLFKCFNQE